MNSVYLILPCYSLDEITLCDNMTDGPSIMSAWLAMFDPENLLRMNKLPQWIPGYTPEDQVENALILMPNFLYGVDYAWLDECRGNGCDVMEFYEESKEDLAQRIHDSLEEIPAQSDNPEQDVPSSPNALPLDKDSFYTLAFNYFFSEMIMRRVRYSSYTDADQLFADFQTAAKAWRRGDVEAMNQSLKCAAERIQQGKECYFPTQNDLCDYCVVTSTKQFDLLEMMMDRMTDSDTIETQIAPSIFMSGRMIEQLKTQRPKSFERLMELVSGDKTALWSGEYIESPLPMMTMEGILDRLYDGLYRYKQNTGTDLKYFGRLSNGLTPLLPGILSRLGIQGVMYCTFDEAPIPLPEKCRIQWTGLDGMTVSAYAQKPIDVEQPGELFRIPDFIAKHVDNDYALGSVTVHSPGPLDTIADGLANYYYGGQKFGAMLGTFSSLKDYFNRTRYSGGDEEFSIDEYKYTFLQHAIDREWPDPLSRWTRYYRCAGLITDVSVMESASALLGSDVTDEPVTEQYGRINESVLKKDCLKQSVYEFDTQMVKRANKAAEEFASKLFHKSDRNKIGKDSGEQITGVCVVNPTLQTVRKIIDISELPFIPKQSDTIRHVYPESQRVEVEVPAMGVIAIVQEARNEKRETRSVTKGTRDWGLGTRETDSRNSQLATRNSSNHSQLDSRNTIQNGLYQLTFDKATGALRNVYDFHTRRNYLAQTLAVRLGGKKVKEDKDDTLDYSISIAYSMECTVTDYEEKMTVAGRLVDREMNTLYTFKQITTVYMGSPTIHFDIRVKSVEGIEQNDDFSTVIPPQYLACRWAWGDSSTQTFISVGGAMVKTENKELLSSEFIVNKSDDYSFALKTFGLPWHRRIGSHRLDSLIGIDGETEKRFRFEVTIGTQFETESISRNSLYVVPVYDNIEPKTNLASVLDVNADNIQITSAWVERVPVENSSNEQNTNLTSYDSKTVLTVRLQETQGQRTTLTMEFFRRAVSAHLNDFCGESIRNLDLDVGRPVINLQPYAWEEVQIEF